MSDDDVARILLEDPQSLPVRRLQIDHLGLEEMVRVTETGCEWLTDPQTELRML